MCNELNGKTNSSALREILAALKLATWKADDEVKYK